MPTKHTSCHPQGTNSATQVISPAGPVQKSFHIKFMIFQQLNVQSKKTLIYTKDILQNSETYHQVKYYSQSNI